MSDDAPRIEYVEARGVLLDALTALEPHIRAVVLIGAQAVSTDRFSLSFTGRDHRENGRIVP